MAISTATYGRSEAGLRTLKANLQGDCSRMINALTGPEYKALVTAVTNNWAGADANDWIKDLQSTVNTLTNNIKSLSSSAQGYLDTDLAAFKSFQAKNIQ